MATTDARAGALQPEGSSRGGDAVSRRTVIAGASWAVPAIALTASAPAFADSRPTPTVSIALPAGGYVPASGAATVTALVTDGSGAGVAGRAVSFVGPSGATFSSSTVTTDATGVAVTSIDLSTPWRRPGSSVTVSALAEGVTATATALVLGSNVAIAGRGFTSTFAQTDLVFPAAVVEAVSGAYSSVSGFAWQMVLLEDGTVWTRGDNQYGQLGDGTTTYRSTWGKVPGLAGVKHIAAGILHAFAVMVDGTLRAWGWNRDGQLGDGSTSHRPSPVVIGGLPGPVAVVRCAQSTTYAVLQNGELWAWGDAGYYRIVTDSYVSSGLE